MKTLNVTPEGFPWVKYLGLHRLAGLVLDVWQRGGKVRLDLHEHGADLFVFVGGHVYYKELD